MIDEPTPPLARCPGPGDNRPMADDALYYNRQGQPIDIATHDRLLRDAAYCLVARDVAGDATVSTVWTGVGAPCLDPDSPPLIFETAAFGPEVEARFPRRYATEAEAIAGHAKVVAALAR